MKGFDETEMTAVEMARLKEWLKSKGMTAEEILQCIDYIAYGKEMKIKTPSSEEAHN